MSTLISFLGKGQVTQAGYRMANYQFADGTRASAKFFGLALKEHIKPARLLLAGTTGSMWDVF